MNPVELIRLIKSGNPQQVLSQMMNSNPQISNNPMAQNAIKMYQNGDTQGLKMLAENLCREQGITTKMFNTGAMPSLADIAAVTGNKNDGGWGDGNGWWVLIILFAIFGGWGNGGWGGNGANGGATPYATSALTQADLQRGFDTQSIVSKLDGISNGLCDGFYAFNNGMVTGFIGIITNI